jgi:hypothetical protein
MLPVGAERWWLEARTFERGERRLKDGAYRLKDVT